MPINYENIANNIGGKYTTPTTNETAPDPTKQGKTNWGEIIGGGASALQTVAEWAQSKKNLAAAVAAGANSVEIAKLNLEAKRLEVEGLKAQQWLVQNPSATTQTALKPINKKVLWIVGGTLAMAAIVTTVIIILKR